MATATMKGTTCRLSYTVGTDPQGKNLVKNRNLSRVNPALTDDVVYGFTQLLLAVQKYPAAVERVDAKLLTA